MMQGWKISHCEIACGGASFEQEMKNCRHAYPASVMLEKGGHRDDKITDVLRASGKALRRRLWNRQ